MRFKLGNSDFIPGITPKLEPVPIPSATDSTVSLPGTPLTPSVSVAFNPLLQQTILGISAPVGTETLTFAPGNDGIVARRIVSGTRTVISPENGMSLQTSRQVTDYGPHGLDQTSSINKQIVKHIKLAFNPTSIETK